MAHDLSKKAASVPDRVRDELFQGHAPGPCGGTGRRARLKIVFRKEWGFDSLHGHHLVLHRTSNNPNNPDQQKVGVSPRARVVPRPLTELDPETAKLIEDVTIDSKGRAIPKLYSKLQANAELRKMLNIAM